ENADEAKRRRVGRLEPEAVPAAEKGEDRLAQPLFRERGLARRGRRHFAARAQVRPRDNPRPVRGGLAHGCFPSARGPSPAWISMQLMSFAPLGGGPWPGT